MSKDFDCWNTQKKQVNAHADVVGVHARELWWIAFGLNVGVEADGKHDTFERPGIILRKFNAQMLWVLPTTSQHKEGPFYIPFQFGGAQYFAALTQIRTISTKRLLRKIGMIATDDFSQMRERIAGLVLDERIPARGGDSRRPKP